LSESEVLTEKQEKCKRKNKLFGVWLPIDVHEWFCNYLKVKSIGSSTGERLRQWLYALQKQNPSVPIYKPKTTLGRWVCIRGFSREATEEAQKRRCETCRKHYPTDFKTCRQVRRQQQMGARILIRLFGKDTIDK